LFNTAIAPLSNGELLADIGTFLAGAKPGEWSWSIVEGSGFSQQ
jgi:hypothetical protein